MIKVTKEQFNAWLAANEEGRAEWIEKTWRIKNEKGYFLRYRDTKTRRVLAAIYDPENDDKPYYYIQEGNTND